LLSFPSDYIAPLVAVLASLIGVELLSGWMRYVEGFIAACVSILGVIDFALNPYLTRLQLLDLNMGGLSVLAVGIVVIWYRYRIISLEKAQQIALDYMKSKPGIKDVSLDPTKLSKLVGRQYHIPVRRSGGFHVGTVWVIVDGRTGKVVSDTVSEPS